LQSSTVFDQQAPTREEQIMKTTIDGHRRFDLGTDLRRGIVFSLASMAVFTVLLLMQRPHWAQPWLIASIFTFVMWRLGRGLSEPEARSRR
jgi:Ca2+/Na+ antiporter